MIRLLKEFRNTLGDSLANTVSNCPWIETPCFATGKLLQSVPLLNKMYPRVVEKLRRDWASTPRRFRTIDVYGHSFIFDITDFTTSGLFFWGHPFEPRTTTRLMSIVQPGTTVLDVGANKGYFSILCGLLTGANGRVYAFEPNPSIVDSLREHVALNRLTETIQIVEQALSRTESSQAELYLSCDPYNSGLASLTPFSESLQNSMLSDSNKTTVTTTTLDAWLRSNEDVPAIDLIKVDVEGAEGWILDGAEKTLRESPPRFWIVETHPQSPVIERLKSFGYGVETLENAGSLVNALFTHHTANLGLNKLV
jgi:FkbM family methyltransferase